MKTKKPARTRIEVTAPETEAVLMKMDAEAYTGGNVSEMLRRAWRVWRGKQGADLEDADRAAGGR